MRSTRRSLRSFVFLSLLLAACGGDGERAARRAEPPADSAGQADEGDPRALYGVPASENVQVTPVEIEVPGLPPGWSGMTVAAVSDLRLGLWPDNERVAHAAMQRAAALRPDLVVLLGDYVARGSDYGALDRVLAPLRGRRVLAVLGHDDQIEDPEEPDTAMARTIQALERNGVQVLRNARVAVGRGGDTAYVAGTEPYVARRPEWRRAEIYGGIPGAPQTVLLLSHMPVNAVTLPTNKYPVVLAGHTFCGSVEVPGTPRLTWVNSEVFPNTAQPSKTRIYRVRGSTLFVTCGVGYSFVPVRYGHPPEVALITLRGVGGPAAADTTGRPAEANLDSLIQSYQQRDTTGGDTAGGDTLRR